MIPYRAPECTRFVLPSGKLIRIERIEGVVVVHGLPLSLYGQDVAAIHAECERLEER